MRQSISRLQYFLFAQGDTSKHMLISDGITIGVGFVSVLILCAFVFTYLIKIFL